MKTFSLTVLALIMLAFVTYLAMQVCPMTDDLIQSKEKQEIKDFPPVEEIPTSEDVIELPTMPFDGIQISINEYPNTGTF